MATWAREDLASGKLSAEDATKLFDELGVPADQRATPTDTRTDEQRLIDAHLSGPWRRSQGWGGSGYQMALLSREREPCGKGQSGGIL